MSDSIIHQSDHREAADGHSLRERLKVAWELEFSNLRPRLMLCMLLARLLRDNRATALRAALVRAIGLDIGGGTRFLGMPKLTSSPGPLRPRLKIGADCTIGAGVILEFGDVLTVGDRVTLGDGVVIITTTHQLGPREHRAGAQIRSPVVIGNDVVIGAEAIILPGAVLGDGAHVSPRSVVNARVAPGATVAGNPAKPLRTA